MISVIRLYESTARDTVNKDENGYLDYPMFNRMLIRASKRLLNFITGGTDSTTPPYTYSTQKAKDFIAYLITKYPAETVSGFIEKPADYYSYENLCRLSISDDGCSEEDDSCESPAPVEILETPIEMLDGQQFAMRKDTYIDLLKPSISAPIAKVVGNKIEFAPKELGSVRLEYLRYPIAGEIVTMTDPVYYNVVADPSASIDSEWGEWAEEMLIFFIADSFANHTREQALKQNNMVTEKLPGA